MKYSRGLTWKEDFSDERIRALADHILEISDEIRGLADSYDENPEERYNDRLKELLNLGSAALEAREYWIESPGPLKEWNLKPEFAYPFLAEKAAQVLEIDEKDSEALREASSELTAEQALQSNEEDFLIGYAMSNYREALQRVEESGIEVEWPEQLIDWRELDLE